MKKLKYILFLIIGLSVLTSCFDDEAIIDLNDDGLNVVTFNRIVDNMSGVAELGGTEYTFFKQVRLVGPTASEVTSDLTVTFTEGSGGTADNSMFMIVTPTITLTKANNYLGVVEMKLTTLGNEPPADTDPAFATYVAPILHVAITATGDATVTGSGKPGKFTLNFAPPNHYAGLYDCLVIYRHPAVGTYPDNVNTANHYDKSFVGITARKMQTNWFGVWDDVTSWITVNADNSIKYKVNEDDWADTVTLGDPFNSTLISGYDPVTGIIQLYYSYTRSNGSRIFWETMVPKF